MRLNQGICLVQIICYFSSSRIIRACHKSVCLPCIWIFIPLLFVFFPSNTPAQPSGSTTEPEKPSLSAALQAPPLPERNKPALPLVLTTPPGAFMLAKPALSWRQKALKLSQEKYKTRGTETANDALIRSFGSNYADTLTELAHACAEAGFQVESVSSNAGELLARNNSSSIRLVFSIWTEGQGKTWISAGLDRGHANLAVKSALLILNSIGHTSNAKGKI